MSAGRPVVTYLDSKRNQEKNYGGREGKKNLINEKKDDVAARE